jgi:ribosome biogenesis GTPase
LHISEAGCAILLRLCGGELSEERYRNYLKLVRESAFNDVLR